MIYGGGGCTLLPDGRVLIVGSACGDCFLELDELYDPVTGTFSVTGTIHTFDCRNDISAGHTATLLANGKVLLTGGTSEGCGTFFLAKLYDRATGTFTFTGNMTTPRFWHTATLLLDGRVLMSGGMSSSAELYTPPVFVAAPMPMLLSLSGDGKGQGAIKHAGTTRIASGDDPAVAGEYLSIYLKGLIDGIAIPPQVAIGGRLAKSRSSGMFLDTRDVVNICMPSGAATRPIVPVRLIYLGRLSNEVTIGFMLEAAMQQAITAMKAAAGTDSLNFWQWAWYWQDLPPFRGAPPGLG